MIKLLAVIFSTITVLLSFIFTTVVKVDVCHATGSTSNPYVLNNVAIHSVDDATGLNGHGDHADDAWMSFVFENVTYPGQNEDLFGTIIDGSCNLIVPPTPTNTSVPPTFTPIPPTSTDVPPTFTPTFTSVPPTHTPTNVPPTSTPTNTPTSTSTATDAVPTPTNTSVPLTLTPTGTIVPPTLTYTPTWIPPTNTLVPPTVTETPTMIFRTPTETPMPTPTTLPTRTSTGQPTTTLPTETPRPPQPADGREDANGYPGAEMGELIMNGDTYPLYLGVNAKDGSLLLPSFNKGAALYQKTVWIHRLWNTGWLDLKVGDTIYFENVVGIERAYNIVGKTFIDYGVYPKTETYGEIFQYIATCYSNNQGQWVGVELFKLALDE